MATEIITKSTIWQEAKIRAVKFANDAASRAEFWGSGRSHFPERFEVEVNGLSLSILVCNYSRRRFDWHIRDVATANKAWPMGADWACCELTEQETIKLAAEIGINISDWLARANLACDRDVFSDRNAVDSEMSEIRNRTEVDAATFHAFRSGDDR